MVELLLQQDQECQQLSLLFVGMLSGNIVHYLVQPRVHGAEHIKKDLDQVVNTTVIDKDLRKPGQLRKKDFSGNISF